MYEKITSPYNNVVVIKRLLDGAFIPIEPLNIDYQEYLKWLENNLEKSDHLDKTI